MLPTNKLLIILQKKKLYRKIYKTIYRKIYKKNYRKIYKKNYRKIYRKNYRKFKNVSNFLENMIKFRTFPEKIFQTLPQVRSPNQIEFKPDQKQQRLQQPLQQPLNMVSISPTGNQVMVSRVTKLKIKISRIF